jgi:signal transduction histidine kinase
MASLDLGPILEQVVNTFIPHADNKAITLELELEEPLTPIWANNLQIEQVVTNLINNALLYTDQGGRVFLQAWIDPRVNKDMVFFSVSDTGPGIPEEDIPHIFERFFRSQTSEDDAIRGTGLGLAICKEIVERHNGTIVVESEAGKGAVFTVGLPVQQNEEVG